VSEDINLYLILTAAFVVTASPGASTLAIAGECVNHGRRRGFAIATGIMLGSWMWSASAAFGLGALMSVNTWIFEVMRILGALYLLYLGWRSARSAWQNRDLKMSSGGATGTFKAGMLRGFLIHLTNPKVILFFTSLYATGVSADSTPWDLAMIVVLLGFQSMMIFIAYVMAFSNVAFTRTYIRLARPFNVVLAIMFVGFAFSLFFAKLPGA